MHGLRTRINVFPCRGLETTPFGREGASRRHWRTGTSVAALRAPRHVLSGETGYGMWTCHEHEKYEILCHDVPHLHVLLSSAARGGKKSTDDDLRLFTRFAHARS